MSWKEAQEWEKKWWGDCANSFYEEEKQLLYAQKMGLIRSPTHRTPYHFDLAGKSVIDIGGGPASLLLKCSNVKSPTVIDPLHFPEWVMERYKAAGILYIREKAERITEAVGELLDEAWIYNVLEHCENPKKVIRNARRVAKLIRIFEWVNIPPSAGHLHTLKEVELNKWLGGEGKVEMCGGVDEVTGPPFRGTQQAFYGVFPT